MHCSVLQLLSLQFCLTPCVLQEDPHGRRNMRHGVCSPCEDTALAEHSHNCCWGPSASPVAVLKSLRRGADIWPHSHTLHNNLSGQAGARQGMLCKKDSIEYLYLIETAWGTLIYCSCTFCFYRVLRDRSPIYLIKKEKIHYSYTDMTFPYSVFCLESHWYDYGEFSWCAHNTM